MAELVNLRQRRKQRKREEKEQKAAQNRVLYGLTTEERSRHKSAGARALMRLEAHRLSPESDTLPE
ncbi:DUF4169 family protein [Nitratireductor sp. GISD-1A_MAKvit]|uniref:DUF4169 family protein n=1 Tax=Nitratireductor sp. GISD-1A_MAKvit TaxID=3234198 RepID=UPI0034651E8D